MKDVSQIKPRLGQGGAGLRHKIKTPIPIVQAMEKQPKVSLAKSPKIQDKLVPIPNYAIPQINHRVIQVQEKPYRMLAGKFQFTLIQFIDPLPNQ